MIELLRIYVKEENKLYKVESFLFFFLINSIFFLEHVRGLEQLLERYNREEEEFRQRNDKKKADLSLNKKNLVAKEVNNNLLVLFIPKSIHFLI